MILTCPVIDILRRDFPQAQMDVIVGPKAVSLFGDNPHLRIKVFDKQASLTQKIRWFLGLYQQHYDCVVDLRRTALAFFLMPKYATPVLFGRTFKGHKKEGHLNRLRQVYDYGSLSIEHYGILTTQDDFQIFQGGIARELQGQAFVVIAPGAADSAKRWHVQGFAVVADILAAKFKVVFVGDDKDVAIVSDIQKRMKTSAISLAGKINLRQLAFVLKESLGALTHDSGVMHLASYFNVPVVAVWGPTDPVKYAPWSEKFIVVRRNEKCPRCCDLKSDSPHQCMSFIEVDDVIKAMARIQQ